MTTPQRPIGSGFGARSTAADVVAGIDLTGRLAIVTGGYSGIGLETSRALAAAGAHVVVPARRPAAARQAVPGVEVTDLDLADLHGVAAFADRFLGTDRQIDVLVAGAGIMACPETRTGPGWEAQFATNHLGHFALVHHLWPALAPDARVVVVSSAGHQLSGIRWDDPHFVTGYDKWLAYGQSKTANALFARHLDTLGVRAFALHPGAILTPLQRHVSHGEQVAAGWVDTDGRPADPTFKTPAQGAATGVWAATSPRLDGLGGVYLENCDVAEPTDRTDMVSGVSPHATDPDEAARLWALSADLTGLDTPRTTVADQVDAPRHGSGPTRTFRPHAHGRRCA